MRILRRALSGVLFLLLSISTVLAAPEPALAATGYTITGTAAAGGITTSGTSIKLTVTLRNNGHAVKKAKALLQYQSGETWVTEKKVTIRRGKASVKVRHGVGDRTYRFTVAGKATSAPFTVHVVPSTFAVSGSGWGHGVGMAQWGAYELAREGRTAADILGYYYPGAVPSTANNPSGTIRVQVLGPPSDSATRTTLGIGSGGFALLDGSGARLAGSTSAATVAIGVSGANVTAKVTLKNGTVIRLPAQSRLQLTWVSGAVSVAGAQGTYRYGRLIITSIRNRPNVVNELVLNTEYLYGLDEMPSSWGTAAGEGQEALKAQVIAARTYALGQVIALGKGVRPECDCQVFDDSRSQNFTGWKKAGGAANAPWRAAVDATVRTNAAQPNGSEVDVLRTPALGFAETPYFASAGSITVAGSTVSGTVGNADAWGTAPVSYLAHVPDPYSVLAPGNPYRTWTRSLTQTAVAALFGLGPLRSVDVTERYSGGLVKSLTATSATGASRTITRTSEGWRKDLGVPGAWVSGITGR